MKLYPNYLPYKCWIFPENNDISASNLKRKWHRITSSASRSSTKQQKATNTSGSKSDLKVSQHSPAVSRQNAITASQSLPFVVGKTYLKMENIDLDLEELLVFFFQNQTKSNLNRPSCVLNQAPKAKFSMEYIPLLEVNTWWNPNFK